jgi:transcriptional regulator with XRE-family HTH domain
MKFSDKMAQARKDKGLSRSALAKLIGTSGAIVGRYERDEMKPSIEVAAKIAEELEVSLDYLAGSSQIAVKDKKMVNRLEGIASMPEAAREQVLNVIDALIFKAKFDNHAAA